MALKTYKPTTPGLRQLAIVDRSELHKGKPVKSLTVGKSEKGGRNNAGRITVRFRGGGHKQSYRIVDFKRRKLDQPAKVERLEYDPNRTAFIALIKYADGEQAYILAPQRLSAGDEVVAGVAGRREARQRDAAGQHPGRHDRAQRRAEDRQGRRDRALRRFLRSDRRPRPGLRLAASLLGRAAPGPRPVLRDRRFGFEPRSHELFARQGGAQPLARPASA